MLMHYANVIFLLRLPFARQALALRKCVWTGKDHVDEQMYIKGWAQKVVKLPKTSKMSPTGATPLRI
jgi:hypothetical protein